MAQFGFGSNNARLTQHEFGEEDAYRRIDPGSYTIEYTDNTHLSDDTWRSILSIEMRKPSDELRSAEQYFELKVNIDGNIEERDRAVVGDAISLCLTRLGLISPIIPPELVTTLRDFKNINGIVIIPDTNCLYNGTMHWLLRVLARSTVWLLPFVISLTQIQQRDAMLKSMVGKKQQGSLRRALRSRAMINAGLGFLQRNHHRYQVVELEPSLLRYMRPAGKGTLDADEGDVLEDRLLIEGVHSILRSTRTRAHQVVATSDILVARTLEAEGIRHVCLPNPTLGAEPVRCVRYDPYVRGFTGAPLRALLWDLAHVFSCIRLVQSGHPIVTLSCYWPGKLPGDWLRERLEFSLPEERASQQAMNVVPTRPALAANKRPHEPALRKSLSDALLPQASLLQALSLAATVHRLGVGTVPAILKGMPESHRPTRGSADRALEVLLRVGLIDYDGENVSSLPELDKLEAYLRSEQLDQISKQFASFAPYQIVLEALSSKHTVQRDRVQALLQRSLGGTVGIESSARLVRYHILLGQAWTDDGTLRDGSQRPDDTALVDEFDTLFEAVSKDNLARVIDLLPELARRLRMSPWAVSREIARLSGDRLSRYSFQPAAGGRPKGVDHTISGPLDRVSETPVPLDRILIAGRPIPTVGRSST